jgi:competence protein ComEC
MESVMKRLCSLLMALMLLALPAMAEPVVFHAPKKGAMQYDAPIMQEYPFKDMDDLLVVDIINVGTGDGILVRAGGETMLIDGGMAGSAGTLRRFMKAQNITRCDYFFNTHPHGDHILAQRQLLIEDCLPGIFLSMYPMDYRFSEHRDTVDLIRKKSVSYHQVFSGDSIHMGKATLTFINDDRPKTRNMNYRSMLLNITFGERSILLTADCTGGSITYVGKKYPELMNVDVMKSPHHGIDRLRQEVFDQTTPEAIIITGTKNVGEKLAAQLRRKKLPHYYMSMGTVRLETDGSIWYVRQEPRVE